MREKHTKTLQVFYAFVLLFDVTVAQNYGPWSNMYTNRGSRPNYQDSAVRANSKRSAVPKRRSFTDVQKEALKSEVMCDVFETLNESKKQSAMMADKQRALEELEERIQFEQEELVSKRERVEVVLSDYNQQRLECGKKVEDMWQVCNKCLTDKCVKHYADNCQEEMPSQAEERDEIVPPCARRPQSPCKNNPRPRPNRPQPQGRMKITVNGMMVSNMEEALETIKNEMTSSISPPCEPGSKFAEFSSVISTQNGGSMNGPMDLGQLLLDQSEKVGRNDKVNITINMNGQKSNFDSFNELFSNSQVMSQLNGLNDQMSSLSSSRNSVSTPSRSSSSSSLTSSSNSKPSKTFSFSSSTRTGSPTVSRQSSSSSITQMGCPNRGGAAGQSGVQDSFMHSPCANKQSRGSRPSNRRNQAASSGCQNGCKTFQSVHVGGQNLNGGRDFFAEARKRMDDMMSTGGNGNSKVTFTSSASGRSPTDGLSQQIVDNGKLSSDGKTFTYSWTGNGDEQVNMDEVIELLNQKFSRSKRSAGTSLRRSSRNIKEYLARSKRYNSGRTSRAVSQCAIEQAAKEAAEQAQRERAERMSKLAQQGGYDSACTMLSAKYGESVTEGLVQQMIESIKAKMQEVNDMCTTKGNCGNTAMHIQVETQGGCENQPGAQPCPNAKPAPSQDNSSNSSLNKISARLESWGRSVSGSWSGKVTQTGSSTKTSSQTISGSFSSGSKPQTGSSSLEVAITSDGDTDCDGESQTGDSIALVAGEKPRIGCKTCSKCQNNRNKPVEPVIRPITTTVPPQPVASVTDVPATDFPALPEADENVYPYDSTTDLPEESYDNSYDDVYDDSGIDTGSSNSRDVTGSDDSYEYNDEIGDDESLAEDAEWSYWSSWSNCDVECSNNGNPGSQWRKRGCKYVTDDTQAQIGTGSCTPGGDVEFRECEPTPPPCSKWAEWGFWTECSSSCGAGQRRRERACMYGGVCEGEKIELENCLNAVRRICPSWSNWNIEYSCSVTCGDGFSSKYRTCQAGQIGEEGCRGEAYNRSPCSTGIDCPSWTAWSAWSSCGVTCGKSQQTRTRTCVNGDAGDVGCEGEPIESKVCFGAQRDCPEWGMWSRYTACSATCGGGLQQRSRICRHGNPGDIGCEGEPEETQNCQAPREFCPTWSIWSSWSSCSVTCGVGIQDKTRECNNGRVGELDCIGATAATRECYGARRECEYWGPWESWHPCSVTCGQGTTRRTRPCMNGNPGDLGCPGEATETDTCEMSACEYFVEYDGDEYLVPTIDKICPEVMTSSSFDKEVIIEYSGPEIPEAETTTDAPEVNQNIDTSCNAILNQNAKTCSFMFADSCGSCDTSIERVCPQLQSLQTELKTLRAEMRICEAKIDHYSGQLKRVQNEVYELHRTVNVDFEWVNTVTSQMLNVGDNVDGFQRPCEIDEVTVDTDFDGYTINVRAEMLIPPRAQINIDVKIEGECCDNRNSMDNTRSQLAETITDHIKRIVQRSNSK